MLTVIPVCVAGCLMGFYSMRPWAIFAFGLAAMPCADLGGRLVFGLGGPLLAFSLIALMELSYLISGVGAGIINDRIQGHLPIG